MILFFTEKNKVFFVVFDIYKGKIILFDVKFRGLIPKDDVFVQNTYVFVLKTFFGFFSFLG